MKFLSMTLVLFSALTLSAAKPAHPQSLIRHVNRINPQALERLADDWEATYGESDNLTALRNLIPTLDARKQAAVRAVKVDDDTAAKALILDVRRAVLAQPLFRDLELITVKYDMGPNARRNNSPAQPSMACYNFVEANNGINSQIVKFSGFTNPEPKMELLYDSPRASVTCLDLNWDSERVVFVRKDKQDNRKLKLWELKLGEKEAKPVTPAGVDYDVGDGCYLPDGRFIITATAAEQGLPCESGRMAMTNTYRFDAKTGKMERLSFDQDSNWSPCITDDGRVMFVRWEYCDQTHFFSRIIMTMRPDGTRQLAYFGSNGFWPNHYSDPLPIPGANGKFISVVTGHHSPKSGKLALFDVSKGRAEGAGCVQMLPGYGKGPDERIEDRMYQNDYPRFLYPYPLGTSPRTDGAGKYFLVAMQPARGDLWGIYLVDIYDNMTLLAEIENAALIEPIRLGKRRRPPVYPDSVKPGSKECTVHVADIYNGPGLRGVPRGTVKSVRVFAYHYAYVKAGSHEGVGTESSWDIKYVLGTAPVNEDGSVYFKAPAHTPISIQPLDKDGKAIQLMRSWFVGMPGEHVACTGCHESANSIYNVPPLLNTNPKALNPVPGLGTTWSFMRDVQPILTRRCAGCHNDSNTDTDMTMDGPYGRQSLRGKRPNLANTSPVILPYRDGMRPGGAGAFTRSYHDLNPYVRRPGPESDNRLMNPGEYSANTSVLVQLLRRGHYGVQLTDSEWRILYTWIDLNAPFWGTWTDFALNWANEFHRNWIGIHGAQQQLQRMNESRARRETWNKAYQVSNMDPILEADTYDFKKMAADAGKVKYEHPNMANMQAMMAVRNAKPEAPANWPMANAKEEKVQVDMPGGSLTFLRIPAGKFIMGDGKGYADELPHVAEIKKPFLMADIEVPLRNFRAWKPHHYNGFVDQLGKDHTSPGCDISSNEWFPAVRVSWKEANDYCAWLSEKTGRKFRLPTEAEWEWAARGGTDTPFYWGDAEANFAPYANLADKALDGIPNQRQTLNYYLRDMRYNDGDQVIGIVGRRKANAFGLKDMIGNVAEWTQSAYKPYPYADDGRNAPEANDEVVSRGGSWDLLPRLSRVSIRTPYPQWQRVANVGIRLVCEE